MTKQIKLQLSLTSEAQKSALARVAANAGFTNISAWLQDVANNEMLPGAAVVGYVKLDRRVATSDHDCNECGNAIGNLDLFLIVHADGSTSSVVCSDCATD